MTDAKAALHELRDTFSEIRDFLHRHGMSSEWRKIRALANMALIDDEPPETVLRMYWRSYLRTMSHRDSFSEVYVQDAAGKYDKEASDELDALVHRLATIANAWGPPERE